MSLQGNLITKLWLISRAFNKLPFSDEILNLTSGQIDWIVQKLAQENPESIQISKDGEQTFTEEQTKTLTLVDAWDSMRGKSKEQFLKERIPLQLRKALEENRKRRSRIANSNKKP
jgi:hypothetical protein